MFRERKWLSGLALPSRLAWFAALVLLTQANSALGQNLAAELYQVFREYRVSLGSEPHDAASYFSRYFVEDVLAYAEASEDPRVMTIIRSGILFGANVEAVYSFESVSPVDGSEALRFVCRCTNFTSGYGTIQLDFVLEDGRRRINLISFDATVKSAPDGVEPVEVF